MENLSLEWDCYADESYDIICHNGSIDDLYWADISQIRSTTTSDFPMGDIGQNEIIVQDLYQDQNSSSLQTMTWTPFQEKLTVPGRNNSDEQLSSSSSSTDYFSCFDSESDDENQIERRHFDAEFKDLNLCLNISVSHANKDPTISITTKAEKKLTGEMADTSEIEFTESCSSVDLLDVQSMVNEQNDKSYMRYRLLDMHDLDIEFLLDDDVPTKAREDFVPSWCKIFKPLSEETDDPVENHSVRNLVEAYENKFKAQEDKSKVSTSRKENEISNIVNVSTETQLEIKIEENLEANTKHTVSTWTTKFEEDFTDDSFQVFRKISESIIRESFEELELESMGDLRIMKFNTGENPTTDQTNTFKKCLNIEEERVNCNDILDYEATPEKNQTTLAIQTQLISEGCEHITNIMYNQEQFVLPSDVIIKTKETYHEQCVEQYVDRTNPQPVSGNLSMVSGSESSDKDQELEWSQQGQIVPVASISKQPPCGKLTCSIVLPETSTLGTTENMQNISEDAIANMLAAFMDNDPRRSIAFQPVNIKERDDLPGQDDKGQDVPHTGQDKEMVWNELEQIKLPPSICLNKEELGFRIDPVPEDKFPIEKLQWSEHGQLVPIKETLSVEEFISPEEKLQWNEQGQLVPVNEVLSDSKLQQAKHRLVSFEERNDVQKNSVKHSSDLDRNKHDKVHSIIASFERSMCAAQKENGFHDLNQIKNGDAKLHTKEIKSGLGTEYSLKCCEKLTQEKPQPPRAKHSNIKNISNLLNKIEKICNGKSVHVQKEHTTQERWYGKSPYPLSEFPKSSLMPKTTSPVLPVTFPSTHVPKITASYGTRGGENAYIDRTELKKEFKNHLESHQSKLSDGGCKQSALKLQYQSKESTINLEYFQEKTAKEILPHTAGQNEEKKHPVSECHKAPTISKYSKSEIGDGRTVYSDVKNWYKQTKVQKLCEVFEGTDPKVPHITYRITKEDPIQTPKTQQQLGSQNESSQYATSRSDGKCKMRFDLERYIRKRGENMMTRKNDNQDGSDEAYYHVAKMLTIRVIANAKLQLSREYSEKDYAKRTTQKESHEAQPQTASPTPICHVVNKSHERYCKNEQQENPQKNPHVKPQKQSNEKITKKSKSSKRKRAAHQKKQPSGSTKKDQSNDEKVLKSQSQDSGCRPNVRKPAVTHKGQQPDQNKKRVQFDI